jgi:hypothetical protein
MPVSREWEHDFSGLMSLSVKKDESISSLCEHLAS